jgi:glutathione S-transferase
MKLYEFGPTRALRARWVLQELEVPYESVVVDMTKGEHRSREFLKLNPAGKLPVLVDGDLVVTESVAIALYLAEKYPDKRLMPTELSERAQAFRWLFFVVTELEQPLWRMARHTFLYPEADRSKAEIALAARDFLGMARVFEAHMKGRPFVVGDRVSIVDFVTAFTLDWANGENLLGDLPALTRYLGRMYERPRAAPRIAERQAS